ncbi:unnamed protein product, partial [Allacma fusca]
PMLKEKYGSTR